MSTDYILDVDGHPNIYNNSPRSLTIYFAIPDNVNDDTGVLLLIPGFGGNARSKVYTKMRREFSEKYNLVVVQCDYFGWKFMQTIPKEETLENFNDMGLMQAIDNLSALLLIIEILKENGHNINKNKIISYGHSHGSYLSYLCNAFAPGLFRLIIDNSAWLFPRYLKIKRTIEQYRAIQNKTVDIEFEYLAKSLEYDKEILNLNYLYKKVINTAKIIIFQGENDFLVNHEEKHLFSKLLNKAEFNLINKNNLDNDIFKSTKHGLDADFLKLFDCVIANHDFNSLIQEKSHSELKSFSIKTSTYEYSLNYEEKIPILNINFLQK